MSNAAFLVSGGRVIIQSRATGKHTPQRNGALRFARKDKTPLPGFEQDDYGQLIWGTTRSFRHILEEFDSVRASTIKLYESFGEDELNSIGTASDKEFTVRAKGYITLGHALHHRLIIQDKYLV